MQKQPALLAGVAIAMLVSSAHAQNTLVFTDFNNVDGLSNTLLVNGSSTGINSITRTGTNDYNFGVSYAVGAETLSFDLVVEGFADGAVTTSLAGPNETGNAGAVTLGGTDVDVAEITGGNIVGAAFGTKSNFDAGKTIKFSVTNLSFTGGTAIFDGFDEAFTQETDGHSHVAIVGLGTGLFERDWNAANEQSIVTSGVTELYISSGGSSTSGVTFGVSSLDFSITTTSNVPEPETYALFTGILGLAFVMIRRLKR